MAVGSQTASIRSASIGPFGSLTPSGELLKLLVSEFQSSFVSKLPLPFFATLVHMDSHWVKPQPPVRRSRTLGAKQVLPRKSPLIQGRTGHVASTLSRTTANVRDRPHNHAPPCPTETQCARPSIRIMALMRRMGTRTWHMRPVVRTAFDPSRSLGCYQSGFWET